MSMEQELNGEDIRTTSENDPKPKKRTRQRPTKKNEKVTVDEVSPESCKAKVFHGTHKTNMLALLNRDRTDEDSYCDVTVHVDGQPFPAHKCILGKLSVFFHKMFKVEMQERYSTDAQVYGVSKPVFQTIFNYMYTGNIKLTEDNVMDILMAADYLQMDALKKFCVEFLGAAMNITNCLEIQRTGQFFNCPSLSDAAETMTARKFREIIEQQQFKDLDKQNLIQFISSRDQKAFGSKDVYEGVLSWVNYDLENRKDDFVELFKLIKLHLMQPDYLEEIVDQQELVQQSHECKDYFQKELLYCLKLSKFMHDTPKPTPAGDSKSVVVSSMEISTDTKKPEPEQHQTKVVLKPTPAQNPIPAKPKNDKKNKKKNSIPKTPSASDIPLIRQNSNSIPNDSPGPSNARVNSPSNAGSDKNYSVELVRILRHGKYADIPLNDDGFANVNDILSNRKLQQKFGQKTIKDLRKLVYSGDKKRFEMKQVDSVCRIRATDKHTVKLRKGSTDDLVASNSKRVSNLSLSSNSPPSSPTPYPGNTEVSKELVKILRHGAYRDIQVDSSGFVNAKKILNHPRFRKFCGTLSMDDLGYIVETSERRYFQMVQVGSEWKIKATHGHSVEVDGLELEPLTEEGCWSRFIHHRTSHNAWAHIQKHGLSRMKRNHIHFYIGIPNASDVEHGRNPNTDIAIVIDFVQATQAGLQFFASTNGTVVCPGNFDGCIPKEFFSHVIQLHPHWERIM